jgi:hypothetical protein
MLSNRELAEEIAKRIFTNGSQDVADRLVLVQEPPAHSVKRDLGGWSKWALADIICEELVAGNREN